MTARDQATDAMVLRGIHTHHARQLLDALEAATSRLTRQGETGQTIALHLAAVAAAREPEE